MMGYNQPVLAADQVHIVSPSSPTAGLPALRQSARSGLTKGLSGFLWLAKILIPISLLTALLAWSGLLARLDPLVRPAMGLLGLPAAAALPLLVGLLAGVYAGLAALVVLPLSPQELTLASIFLLIAHNLIQEGVIQGQSGLSALKATLWRLAAAVVTVAVCARFLGGGPGGAAAAGAALAGGQPLVPALQAWALATLRLLARILVIVVPIIVLLEVMKGLGWADRIARVLAPLLRLMGLSRRVGFLWLTATIFGLSYGAAIILAEAREGRLEKEELESLQVSAGINHAVIEDPVFLMSLGVSVFWSVIPRLAVAVAAVWLLFLWRRLARRSRGG